MLNRDPFNAIGTDTETFSMTAGLLATALCFCACFMLYRKYYKQEDTTQLSPYEKWQLAQEQKAKGWHFLFHFVTLSLSNGLGLGL